MLIDTVETAAGPFSLLVDSEGAVVASGFGIGLEGLLARLPAVQRLDATDVVSGKTAVREVVQAWNEGDYDAVLTVAVSTPRHGFLPQVWDALRTIPAGTTITYAELAAKAGRPQAVRAAAQGCARNPVALFIPCHRVLRADGKLGGFAFGVAVKQTLLAHEAGRSAPS